MGHETVNESGDTMTNRTDPEQYHHEPTDEDRAAAAVADEIWAERDRAEAER